MKDVVGLLLARSDSSCATRSFSCFTSFSSCRMYAALRSLDSLAVIRFLARLISLDIPEGFFLFPELLTQAVFKLGKDAFEIVLVFEPTCAIIALDLSDEFKRIRNTRGEFTVI